MNNILSNKTNLNNNMINIIGEYSMISKEETMRNKSILFNKPTITYKITGFGNIKSQALQFKLRKYGKYLDIFDIHGISDMVVINFLVPTKYYDLLFPTSDLLSYVSEIDLTDPQNKENFYVFLYIQKVDVLNSFRNYMF